MAWKRGADPYKLYNSLDERYRPLATTHPCPSCWAVRQISLDYETPKPCGLCGGRGEVEIPLGEPGDPLLPPHPARIRAFIYGCAKGLAEAESGQGR